MTEGAETKDADTAFMMIEGAEYVMIIDECEENPIETKFVSWERCHVVILTHSFVSWGKSDHSSAPCLVTLTHFH